MLDTSQGIPVPQPDLREVRPGLKRLAVDYVWDDGQNRITVPAGTLTNGASSPRFVWTFVSRDDCGEAPTLVHDYLYQVGGITPARTYSRLEADQLFLTMMLGCGVPEWRAEAAYHAVRLRGAPHWRTP